MEYVTFENLSVIRNQIFKKISEAYHIANEYTEDKISFLAKDIKSSHIPKSDITLTSGTAGIKEDTVGNVIEIPWFDVNEYGIITAYGTRRHTISSGGDDM